MTQATARWVLVAAALALLVSCEHLRLRGSASEHGLEHVRVGVPL